MFGERQVEPGNAAPGAATRYQMTAQLFTLAQEFWIENQDGQRVYKVQGKLMSLTDALAFTDAGGNVLVQLHRKLPAIKPQFIIERSAGGSAVVKRALFVIVHDHLTMTVQGMGALDGDYDIRGDLTQHEYTIRRGDAAVAQISKQWFSLHDSYGVEVAPGSDAVLVLAAAVAVDQLIREADDHD